VNFALYSPDDAAVAEPGPSGGPVGIGCRARDPGPSVGQEHRPGVAVLGFALFAPVGWLFVVPLAAGFLVGGWCGPKLVRGVPAQALRMVVAIAGVALAVKLGLGAYR
jgi:hypothetical protein